MQALTWNHTLRYVLHGRAVQRAALIVNLLLLILIAYSVGSFGWMLWTKINTPPAAAAPVVPATPPAPAVDIVALHLFGESSAEVATDAENAPETPLKLTLRGVFATEDKGAAYAIIAGPDGKEMSYGLEDELPGGAVLKAVFADRVILTRNGRNETLSLPKDILAYKSPPAAAAPLPAAAVPQPMGRTTPSAPGAVGIGGSLRSYREALRANLQSLAGLVQIGPVQQGGKFVGYSLHPGTDPGLFSRMGLQPGDVVTAVNGITLDNPARAPDVLNALTTANDLRLTLLRNGAPHSVAFSLQE